MQKFTIVCKSSYSGVTLILVVHRSSRHAAFITGLRFCSPHCNSTKWHFYIL